MKLTTSLCLALACALPLAAAKPKPKPAAVAATANPEVPAAGAGAELLVAGKGRAVAGLRGAPTDFQATAMGDGRVLVTGGSPTDAGSQWFDPEQRRFSAGPALTMPRQGHRALRLKDGRLLVVGGTEARNNPEILEPGAAAFQPLAGDARFGLSADATELDDGRILMVDGGSGQCFTWDGKKSFRFQGNLNRPRYFFALTRTRDGRILITGGLPAEQQKDPRRRGRVPAATSPNLPVESFNPRWSTLSAWKALPLPRAHHQATLLEDGRICLWAGFGQDPGSACEAVEILDPGKESVTAAGTLALAGKAQPGWGDGRFLAEQSRQLLAGDPLALVARTAPVQGRLANAYLAPTVLPLNADQVLVLGSPAWGVPVDRWDPRSKQCMVVGSLRAEAEGLAQTPDGKLISVGPVLDLLDPRSGSLTALGWREDLAGLLPVAHPLPPVPGRPPFAPGEARRDYLLVSLDKTHALVVGGTPEDGRDPSGKVELWDLKRRTLTPMGPMRTRRTFPAGAAAQGGLRLADGSVMIWGPGLI
jgi:hypothetical protein